MNTEKKIRIVADTNIIISALNFGGNPAKIIFLAKINKLELYLSKFILEKIYGVLIKKFKWQPTKAQETLDLLKEFCYIAMPLERIFELNDEGDNRVLECALASQAHYIVSGDNHLLKLKKYQNTKIMTARQFLNIFL